MKYATECSGQDVCLGAGNKKKLNRFYFLKSYLITPVIKIGVRIFLSFLIVSRNLFLGGKIFLDLRFSPENSSAHMTLAKNLANLKM